MPEKLVRIQSALMVLKETGDPRLSGVARFARSRVLKQPALNIGERITPFLRPGRRQDIPELGTPRPVSGRQRAVSGLRGLGPSVSRKKRPFPDGLANWRLLLKCASMEHGQERTPKDL
jgi:hypothetical protein